MDMTDTRQIDAPRDVVWAALTSAEVLRACVPGCTELTGSAEDGFDATVVQKVGPVKATFKGRVILSDMTRPEALTLTGEGKGGAAGFAKGGARVRLADTGDGRTELDYDLNAKVGGKLAQLGSRIIDGFARKMADQFFDNFQTAVEGPAEDDADETSDQDTQEKGWFRRLIS